MENSIFFLNKVCFPSFLIGISYLDTQGTRLAAVIAIT
jgi:hypothetical protein